MTTVELLAEALTSSLTDAREMRELGERIEAAEQELEELRAMVLRTVCTSEVEPDLPIVTLADIAELLSIINEKSSIGSKRLRLVRAIRTMVRCSLSEAAPIVTEFVAKWAEVQLTSETTPSDPTAHTRDTLDLSVPPSEDGDAGDEDRPSQSARPTREFNPFL